MADDLKLGKLDARPNAIKFKLAAYVGGTKAFPTVPKDFGHEEYTPPIEWGMLGNNQYGDCVVAGGAHEHMLWNRMAGRSLTFSTQDVLNDFQAITGQPPSPNVGADMQQAASYRLKTGLLGADGKRHKIAAYLEIAPGNLRELYIAMYEFAAVGIGIQFPSTAFDQFRRHQSWHIVSGSRIEAGHYIPAFALRSNIVTVTWGRFQAMRPSFFGAYCVDPKTRILTDDLHWVAAGELSVGAGVMGFDEHGPRRRWKRAFVEATDVIERPCYDVEFSDGTVIRCSREHEWLSADKPVGWVRTDQTRFRKNVRSRIVKPVDIWNTDLTREGGYLAAAFDGEGHIQQRKLEGGMYGLSAQVITQSSGAVGTNVCFSQKQNAMLSEVKRCLEEKGFDYNFSKRRSDVTVLSISRRRNFLKFLGSIRPLRLLEKFDADAMGGLSGDASRVVTVVNRTDVGVQKVVALKTTSRTYIAEGLASHNCDEAVAYVSQEALINGRSPEGFDYASLIADLRSLRG